jgi:hypothetical protein
MQSFMKRRRGIRNKDRKLVSIRIDEDFSVSELVLNDSFDLTRSYGLDLYDISPIFQDEFREIPYKKYFSLLQNYFINKNFKLPILLQN